jgi:hypothetical protein
MLGNTVPVPACIPHEHDAIDIEEKERTIHGGWLESMRAPPYQKEMVFVRPERMTSS